MVPHQYRTKPNSLLSLIPLQWKEERNSALWGRSCVAAHFLIMVEGLRFGETTPRHASPDPHSAETRSTISLSRLALPCWPRVAYSTLLFTNTPSPQRIITTTYVVHMGIWIGEAIGGFLVHLGKGNYWEYSRCFHDFNINNNLRPYS